MSGKRILMVVAPQNFRDEELFASKAAFEVAGASVTVASKGVSTAYGMLGGVVSVDAEYSEVSSDDFDAVVFVGGGGSRVYWDDPVVHSLAREFIEQGKIVSAICIAPVTLANAGLLSGKNATVFEGEGTLVAFEKAGVQFTGDSVTVDGNIITANGPQAAGEFAEAVLEVLG